MGSGITSGDTLVLLVADQSTGGATVNSVTGGGVTTWQKAGGTGSTGNGDSEIWYGTVTASGQTNVTVNLSARTNFQLADLSEWSGLAATPLDKTNSANGSGTAVTAGAVTPSVAGDLVISGAYVATGDGTQPAPSNGFTSLTEVAGGGNFRGYPAYLIDGSTSAISTTWTAPGSGSWSAAIASFEP